KPFLCPARSRPGMMRTGDPIGPITDYNLNAQLNKPDDTVAQDATTNLRRKLEGIPDGASNTVLLGQKAFRWASYGNTLGSQSGYDETFLQGRWGGASRAG